MPYAQLSGANRDRYEGLKSDLNNQYGFGKDLYPKSPDLCLSLLNCRLDAPLRQPRQNIQAPPQVKQEEEALVFAQGTSDKKTASKSREDRSMGTRLRQNLGRSKLCAKGDRTLTEPAL